MSTIREEITKYLGVIQKARKLNTVRAYQSGLKVFTDILRRMKIDPTTSPPDILDEEHFKRLISGLSIFSAPTERLYLQAVKGFYLYLDSEKIIHVNQSALKIIMSQRARRPGIRLPQFENDAIDRLLETVQDVRTLITEPQNERDVVIAYRDRALLITLASTGLRIHEAIGLRRSNVDWTRHFATVIGKGDKEAIVRFTSRSIRAIKDYFAMRSEWDSDSGKMLSAHPVFACHSSSVGKKIKPITTSTGRDIVTRRVIQILGKEMEGKITPHSFRHYFVTVALRASGSLAHVQELARHANIETTKRYTHLADDELDEAYHKFEEYLEEH